LVLIDASALIALLGDEPAAPKVQALLREGAAIATLNLAEAIERLQRRYGLAIERIQPVVEDLLDEALTLLPLGASEAWRAAEIRATYYDRARCPLSLADAVLIATSASATRLAGSDGHVLKVAAAEGIAITVLPDSQGRRASPGAKARGADPGE
jgi:PIN domain nuclease of toxin-antitoxin system